jgi:hypothetical protein
VDSEAVFRWYQKQDHTHIIPLSLVWVQEFSRVYGVNWLTSFAYAYVRTRYFDEPTVYDDLNLWALTDENGNWLRFRTMKEAHDNGCKFVAWQVKSGTVDPEVTEVYNAIVAFARGDNPNPKPVPPPAPIPVPQPTPEVPVPQPNTPLDWLATLRSVLKALRVLAGILSGVAIFVPAIGPIVGIAKKVLDALDTMIGEGLTSFMKPAVAWA